MAGQNIVLNHNLNNQDISVEILGRTTSTGGVHQKNLGLTGFTNGWTKVYGGAAMIFPMAIIYRLTMVDIIFSGNTGSFGAGSLDGWIIKTDSVGNMEWNITYGGSLDDSFTDMVKIKDDNYVLCGYTGSFGAGNYDFW